MARLARIQAQIGSMDQLLGVVGAMRSLAAVRMQQAQRALPGIQRYTEQIASGLASSEAILRHSHRVVDDMGARGARRVRPAIVLVTSEHGFVAGYNDKLLETFENVRSNDDAVFMVGTRGLVMAAERGIEPTWSCPMVTRCEGATDLVRRVSSELYSRLGQGVIGTVDVVHSLMGPAGRTSHVSRQRVFPVDMKAMSRREPKRSPLSTLDPAELHSRMVNEYVFALLMRAIVEAVVSENATRFSAMQAARENIVEKLRHLRQTESLLRQEEITSELLELSTGTDAQQFR